MQLTLPYHFSRRYLPVASYVLASEGHTTNESIDAYIADIPSRQQLKSLLATTLRTAGLQPKGRLSIAWVDSAYSQQLNTAYRHKDKPTNVLSFAPDAYIQQGKLRDLGELVVCLPVVVAEAAEQNKTVLAHTLHLLVHGILHLLGYDHELGETEASLMEGLEIKVLAQLGLANPYTATDCV